MSWSFNPFTGNLDLVGGGGTVVFEGEVETFADLPETVGDPAVGASYLVRSSTGVWLVNRRQAGIWIRKNNTGVRATDWEYGGDYPVNSVAGKTGNVTLTNSDISGLGTAATANLNAISDADLLIVGSTDATKKVAIEVDSLVSAGTTRTLTVPNGDATIAATPVSRLQQFFSSQTYNVVEGLNVDIELQNSVGSCAIVVVLPRLTTDGARSGDEILLRPASLGSGSSYTLQRYIWTGSGYIGSTETITTMEVGQAYRLRLVGGVWTLLVTPNLASPPAIGSTTRNSGAFTTLSANNGTITASAPVLDLSQTWNNAAVTFTGLRFNVTNTASAAASLLADFQVGGTSRVFIREDGAIRWNVAGPIIRPFSTTVLEFGSGGVSNSVLMSDGWAMNSTTYFGFSDSVNAGSTRDVRLFRDAAAVLALRNLANPQAFRIYNTTDAGLTNYERGFMRWSSNVLQIGTEKGGTGSARNVQLQRDGTTFLTLESTSAQAFNSWVFFGTVFANGGITMTGSGNPLVISGSNNIVEQRNGANSQTFRLFNTHTSSTSFECLNIAAQSAGSFIIGTEKGSVGGTARGLELRTDNTARLTFGASGTITLNTTLAADAQNISTDTTTGTKIGTSTTQKLGFFNATPVTQRAAIADATDAATTQARLNDLLAAMRSLGLIAT